MGLEDVRRRLPVVGALPEPGNRRHLPVRKGEAPVPALATWEFTLACDQRCIHCGPRAGPRRPDELDTDEALQVVDELAELGVGEVVLIGGEAYLRDDFLLVIRRCRERGMAVTMTTGGWNLSPQRCEAAKEAGLNAVSVSIDGLEPRHDRLRNRPGSFGRAFAALRAARAAGLRISSNTQINRLTHPDMPELLERLAAEGIWGWQIQFTMAHGNAADNVELLVQPYELPEIFEMIDGLLDRCRELGVHLWPANNVGYFGPLERKLRGVLMPGKHYPGCKAGVRSIALESNGIVKNCPSMGGQENVGGSWREHGLRAIWERSAQLGYIRHRTLDDLWGFCRACYYADVCMGGCTATSEPLLGRPGNNPYCLHRALTLREQGLRERLEHVAPAPGVPFDAGLFRLLREPLDPDERARQGPVLVEEPRTSRVQDPTGPGRPR